MALPVHASTTVATAESANPDITSHTVSGTDPALIVKISFRDNSVTVNSVIWDEAGVNEAMTELNSTRDGNAFSAIYYRAAPAAKTATISIDLSGSVRTVAVASTYTGCDQTDPFRIAAAVTNGGTDASPQTDVVALADEMVVDCLCQVSAGPDTATADHTQRHNDSQTGGGTDTRGASQEKSSTGATETMGWSMGGSDNWSMCAGPLQGLQGGFVPLVDLGGLAGQGGLAGAGGGLVG